ncbi:MAG: adenylyl-sulfate kinase [Candidatus Pacebacteria bacterium]|nr:adenylyl-sulfate kinase [Candidatus Paceibacterota bacterium]
MSQSDQFNDDTRRNVTWHSGAVTRRQREVLLGQRGGVIWFTGLSGSGKSTIARALEERLIDEGHLAYVLDGDNVRHGLNADLGFSPDERCENIRRIGEVATLFADCGILTLTAFISPYRDDRQRVRGLCGDDRFVEVYLDVPVATCEARDPKNLYKKARSGELREFTGVNAPYEPPLHPDVRLDTSEQPVAVCVQRVVDYLTGERFLFPPTDPSEGKA